MKWKTGVLIFVSLLILAGIVLFLNPAELVRTIASANPVYILYGFIFANLALVCRVYKWKVLLPGISFGKLAPVQFFGITVSNLTPGKIGEPVKTMALKAVDGTPISVSLPSVIWERIMDVLVLILFGLSGISLIAAADYLPLIVLSVVIFSVLIAFLFLIMYSEQAGRKAIGLFKRFPVLKKIDEEFLTNFYRGCRISHVSLLGSFAWTLVAWLLDGMAFYAVYLALAPAPVDLVLPVMFTCILALSVLIGLLSFLPGGVGGTEVVMILILSAAGIPHDIGGSTVLIGRALTFGWSIVAGYVAFVYLSRKVDTGEITKMVGL
ncbi:MAG: flippase-like domain-containing protein [Methanoregulaceae archaeon]|nr:flippase-like domain-containing protein [Methanoregulaceae archaeon]